jgi:hypothetical protein
VQFDDATAQRIAAGALSVARSGMVFPLSVALSVARNS